MSIKIKPPPHDLLGWFSHESTNSYEKSRDATRDGAARESLAKWNSAYDDMCRKSAHESARAKREEEERKAAIKRWMLRTDTSISMAGTNNDSWKASVYVKDPLYGHCNEKVAVFDRDKFEAIARCIEFEAVTDKHAAKAKADHGIGWCFRCKKRCDNCQ